MSTRRAAIYVRISSDRDGDAAGVGRQESDCKALADRQGWTVARVYVENDTSAFKRQKVRLADGSTAMRVVRPQFRAMLTDLASGTCDAVIAYDLDRAARDPRDLEDLVDVVEQFTIPTRSVTGSLDLSNDSGVTMARVMVAMANKSSRDTSRRISRKMDEKAERGEPKGGGRRGYGYERDGLTIVEAEAATLRRIAELLTTGSSLGAVAQALNNDGIPTVTGARWSGRSVHSVISKPRVAGLRTHRGEIVGDASWPAILRREDWERVLMALDARANGATNQLVKWLTGVLFCADCGQKMHGWSGAQGRSIYWCASPRGGCGKTTIDGVKSERTVAQLAIAYLKRTDVASAIADTAADSSIAKARAEAAADEAQLKELAGMWGRRELTSPEFMAARKEIETRLARWRAVAQASMPAALRHMAEIGPAEAFENMTPVEKREMAQYVFPHGIDVLPFVANGRPNQFDPTRLQVRKEAR